MTKIWRPRLESQPVVCLSMRSRLNSERQDMHTIDTQLILIGQLSPCPDWSDTHTHTHRLHTNNVGEGCFQPYTTQLDYGCNECWLWNCIIIKSTNPPMPPPPQAQSRNPPWARPSPRDGTTPHCFGLWDKIFGYLILHAGLKPPPTSITCRSNDSHQIKAMYLLWLLGYIGYLYCLKSKPLLVGRSSGLDAA